MLREGNGKFEACNPGNHIKAKVKFNILFISCLDQPSAKLQIMIVFPVLIPGQNFLFSREREGKLQNATGREGKFEACIPGNHGKLEFPLTPGPIKKLLHKFSLPLKRT